ncbi:hypothetical protein SAMN05192530_1071, partial [Aureimonas jatrophae]
ANAGAATEMTATAEALSGEASSLNQRTAFFQLEARDAGASGTGGDAPVERARPLDVRALRARAAEFVEGIQPSRRTPQSVGSVSETNASQPGGATRRTG